MNTKLNNNKLCQNTKLSIHYQTTLTVILLLISFLNGCADFKEDSEQPTPPVQTPIQSTPTTPVVPPIPKKGETPEQMQWRMCEAERLWAFNSRIIDDGELHIYRKRNFAPVFNNPGERQSGIEGWYPCVRALETNGFVIEKN
jgi:hypothetical protein